MFRALAILTIILGAPASAFGQFSNTPETDSGFALDLSGNIVRTDGAPVIEAGDGIAAFFGEQQLGNVVLTASEAANETYTGLKVFGDNPNTLDIEGPAVGEVITFRYYDASTNTVLTAVRALNDAGELVNYQWNGSEVIPNPFGLPIPLNNSDTVTLQIGSGTGDTGGDGGNNGGGQTPTGNPDVDGDGRITRNDAAMVLRVVIGGGRLLDAATIARADVDGNGTVSTDDAIAVYKAM